jgi:sugar lactone lactonase YvrE
MRRTRLGLVVVAVVLGSGCWLANASADVYWSNFNDGGIGRANLDGSDPTTVASPFIASADTDGPEGIAVDGRYIYWADYTSGEIGRANLDGSDPTSVASPFIPSADASGSVAVAVDAQHIYWANAINGGIGRANLDGSDPTSVASPFIPSADTGAASGVAVDGQHIYWTNLIGGGIGRANLDGSDPTTAASPFIPSADTSEPFGLAVDGQHIYWANHNGGIGRANLDGSDPTTVASPFIPSADTSDPSGVAVDGRYIYWVNAGSGGIGRANLDGSDPTTVASPFIPSTDTSQPPGVAVDAGPAGAATPSASSLTFASQPLDTYSTPQALTVTDTGHGELQIGSAEVSSGDVDDFLISHDTCSGATLWTGDTCAIDVRFGPIATSATNGRSAALTLTSNDLGSPLSITLQGTGGQLPQGPPGKAGATGPRGPAGEIELVTCRAVTKGKGKHKKTTQKCTTKLTSKPVKFKTAADVSSAVLSRGAVVYATGSAIRAGDSTKLLLTPRRKIRDGSYTLKLTHGRDHQRETITIR